MKVIKKGKKIKGTMRVRCQTCEAELEIQAEDLKKGPEDMYSSTRYFFKCPCCKRNNYIKAVDLSKEILFDLSC